MVEADKYFPDGTDVIVQVNLNQLLGSSLLQKAIPLAVKKYGDDLMKQAAEHIPDPNVKQMIEQMGPNLKEQLTEETVVMGMNAARMGVQDLVIAFNTKEEKDNNTEVMIMVRSSHIQESMLAQIIRL